MPSNNGTTGNEALYINTKTHRVKAPMDSNVAPADLDFTGLSIIGLTASPIPTADFARLSLPNVFSRENTFRGIRLGEIKIVNADKSPYTIIPTDGVILADCTDGDVNLFLPPATGNGQTIRIRRIDTDPSDNDVLIQGQFGDMIDTYNSLTISDYRQKVLITDAMQDFWDLVVSPYLVHSQIENTFTAVNNFSGLRVRSKTVTDIYNIQDTDYEILVDCSVLNKDIEVILPLSLGNGQMYHIKKIDTTNHIVSITTQGADEIDGANSVSFSNPGSDSWLIAGAPDYWDNTGPSNVVIIPATIPATPTTLNGVIDLLEFYGLCA
jgi:hypothetical protein